MSEAIRKGKEDAQNEIQSLKALYSISQDNKRSMDDRMKAVEELQRKYPKYFGNLSDEEILLGKGKIAYNNLTEAMYRNAVTRASLDKITENSKEMLKLDEAITWRKREILRMETAIADIRGNRKENELSQQESDKIDAFNISLVVLRGEMARMKKGYDAFNRSNERLKGNLDISGLIDQNTQSLEGSTESIDDETTAMSLLRNELEKLKESQAGASPTSELGQRGSILGDTLKRLMSTDQIEQYNKFINDESKKQLEYEQEVADKKASIIEKGWNIAKQLGESYFEWYNNKLDDEMEAFNTSNDQRLAELENANRLGLITNEDYQTQKLQLEAEADAKQNEIDKKQRQAKKDAFLLEQGIALAQVWVDYAKAVGATGFNPLLQPWYLGEAIAMSALIAAQTIPAFAEGGTVDKDGNILVGDGGRREAVISPDGRIYITPDVPTVINAKRGSEILPDASILNNRDIMRSLMVDAGYGMNTKALERKFDILTSEVKKLKQSPQKGTRLMDEIQIARNLKLN
jgi:hypothetical protein